MDSVHFLMISWNFLATYLELRLKIHSFYEFFKFCFQKMVNFLEDLSF
jgi:hypothetical protein